MRVKIEKIGLYIQENKPRLKPHSRGILLIFVILSINAISPWKQLKNKVTLGRVTLPHLYELSESKFVSIGENVYNGSNSSLILAAFFFLV